MDSGFQDFRSYEAGKAGKELPVPKEQKSRYDVDPVSFCKSLRFVNLYFAEPIDCLQALLDRFSRRTCHSTLATPVCIEHDDNRKRTLNDFCMKIRFRQMQHESYASLLCP